MRTGSRLAASSTAVCLLALAGVPALSAGSPASAHSTSASVPVPLDNSGRLYGVHALSPTEALSVGSSGEPENRAFHFDGSSWDSTNPPSGPASALVSVDSLSATDAWAVGGSAVTGKSLAYHWDGSVWTPAQTPDPPSGSADLLESVTMVSSTDVWAVGYNVVGESQVRTQLIEHWDGQHWSDVSYTLPPGQTGGAFWGVTSASSDDVWAVGYLDPGTFGDLLIEHWDGTAWLPVARVPKPVGPIYPELNAITAVSANDIWAVGDYLFQSKRVQAFRTAIMHFNGQRWTLVPSPNGPLSNKLDAVSATSADDVWAVGLTDSVEPFDPAETLILHWDGTQWSTVPSPDPGVVANDLFSVSADSPTDAWAVGYSAPNFDETDDTFMYLHWDGSAWTVYQ